MDALSSFVYIAYPPNSPRVKIGYTKRSLKKLKNRYSTSYGTDCIYHVYLCSDPYRLEQMTHTEFKKYRISLELFDSKYIEEYKLYLQTNAEKINNEVKKDGKKNNKFDALPITLTQELSCKTTKEEITNNSKSKYYTCPRCGYKTVYKNDMRKHLNIDTICKPKVSENNLVEYKRKVFQIKNKPYCCEICDKTFASKLGWQKHISKCTEEKNDKQRLTNLEKEIQVLKNIISGDSQSATNINIENNSTTLRPFGQENMEPLSTDLIGDLFLTLNIPELLNILHCNPAYPENHNIRIKSIKRQVIEIFRGNKWDTVTYLRGLNEFAQQAMKIFQTYYDNNANTIKEKKSTDELEDILKTMRQISNMHPDAQKRFHKDLATVLESLRSIESST